MALSVEWFMETNKLPLSDNFTTKSFTTYLIAGKFSSDTVWLKRISEKFSKIKFGE